MAVKHVVVRLGLSTLNACRLVVLQPSSYYYRAHKRDDSKLRKRILELAEKRRRFGQHRIWIMLRREGWKDNRKRVARVYREEGLQVRRRKRKKLTAAARAPMPAPTRANQQWSMDFLMDTTTGGRRIRVLAIVDEFTRECLGVEVDTSIGGTRVARRLERIVEFRGKPDGIKVDNGPEFAGRALDAWAYENKIRLIFSRPGTPTDNAYIESFNGKFRNECINDNEFSSLNEARNIIERWREDYNDERPHSSLGDKTPSEFAKLQAEKLQLNDPEILTRKTIH